jgi:hypothetical protein
MRNAILTVAVGIALSLSTASFAQEQQQPVTVAPAAPAQQAAATPDKNKPVCRVMYHQGSLIRTQQCKTQAQWDNERRAAQRDVSDFQNRNYQTSSGH